MKKPWLSLFVYTARVIILLLLCGILAVKGKGWLEIHGIQISDSLYSWLAYIAMSSVLIFGMPKILNTLRELKPEKSQVYLKSDMTVSITNKGISIYRCRYIIVFLEIMAVAFMAFLTINSTGHVTFMGYLIGFGFWALILLHAGYLLWYAVRVDGASVTIRGFSTKKFLLNEVVEVRIDRVRWLHVATVKLINGKKYTFYSLIKNFSLLIETLRLCTKRSVQ
jgi:hypothetical protein